MSFQTIANINIEYPAWFFEGKTTLLRKPVEFTSDTQTTCLNTMYNWFTPCLLEPTNEHLETPGLMDGVHRGARAGCNGSKDNLLIVT